MPRPLSYERPSKSVLLRLYKSNTDEVIANMFGCTQSAVQKWRTHYGIKGLPRSGRGIGTWRRYVRPSKQILRNLTETKTDAEIALMYGCSRTAMRKWRKSYGLVKTSVVHRRRPWAFSLDEDFFEKIDTEQKAYILGFLATDGNVSDSKSNQNRVTLCLQERDEHILKEILQAMRSDSPINSRPKGSFPGSGPMRYIAMSSKKLASDLAKWGILPRKSMTLTYTNVSRNLERHYIRGLFDGDGCIHKRGGFYLLGTEALIDGVIDAVNRHTGIVLTKSKAGRLYRANGYRGSVKVLHWIYRRSTIFLHRKKKTYDEHYV